MRYPVTTLLLAGLAILPLVDVSADWPQWRGPDRTGSVVAGPLLESLPESGQKPLWQIKDVPGGNSGGWGSPAISNGRVFVFVHTKTKNSDADLGPAKFPWLSPEKRTMSDEEYRQYEIKRRDESERRAKAYRFDQRLLCVDLESGEVVWDHSQPSVYTRFTHSGTPCVIGNRVLVLAPGRLACCWDATSGEILWSQKLPGEFRDEHFSSSFVADGADGDVAVVACGALFGLNVEDGTILLQGDTALDYASHSSPTIWQAENAAVVIANTSGSRTVARRLTDGKLLWELESGASQSSPIVVDNRLLTYGSSRKSGLTAFALDPAAPEKAPSELWRYQRSADQGCSPAVANGFAFVQGERRMAKVDLSNGKAAWQETLPISSPRYTSPIVVGQQLLFGWQGVVAIDAAAEKFELIYDAKVTSDGRLVEADPLRKELGLDQLGDDSKDLAESEKIWQSQAIRSGPLDCSTPAATASRVVLRLRDGLICYDLGQ